MRRVFLILLSLFLLMAQGCAPDRSGAVALAEAILADFEGEGARSTKDENGKTVYIEGNKTKVLAAFDGKAVYVGSQTYTGRLVVIDHGSGLKTWYSNLSSDIQVQVGDTVKAGDVISRPQTEA